MVTVRSAVTVVMACRAAVRLGPLVSEVGSLLAGAVGTVLASQAGTGSLPVDGELLAGG